ncbi:hypothetical protein B0H14DRAFT_2592761 [Mycena olivaceomarginata]|nr:hypothetical protein B0H14DRAFT_2592761 [Mycena olivaceomarginata]
MTIKKRAQTPAIIPCFDGNVVPASDIFPEAKALSFLHVNVPPPYTTLKRVLNVVSAKAVSRPEANGSDSLTYNASINLGIHGQGTVIANCTSPAGLLFSFSTEDNSKLSLYAQITEFAVNLWQHWICAADPVSILGAIVNEPPKAPTRTFLRPEMSSPARYWISVDHKNGILRFGRDYANLVFVLYEARLKQKVDPGVWHWIDEKYAFIDHLTTVNVQQRGGNPTARPLQLVSLPLPVVQKLPPIIVPSASITLDQIAMGSATVPAHLSAECQVLYANVAAIERSVNTEGLLCQTLLKKKASEFGKEDYMSTDLRITLGADLGNSPGPPYVLEIWPALHASPIHNRGDSHAVIKVLHGKIKPIGPPANLEKGDITWIDPENYQVHQLSNESRDGSVCCTIQCYSYGAKDVRHYEAFDYVNEVTHKVVEQFEPNGDMRYDEFKAALKQEWSRRWEQVSKA